MILSEYIKDYKRITGNNPLTSLNKILSYTDFITQPLNLSMFIPAKLVNGKWEVLEEPDETSNLYVYGEHGERDLHEFKSDLKEYQQALDNLVFNGFEFREENKESYSQVRYKDFILLIDNNKILFCNYSVKYNTIEDIIEHVELTDKIKQKYGI